MFSLHYILSVIFRLEDLFEKIVLETTGKYTVISIFNFFIF